jgi:hypothetical protein
MLQFDLKSYQHLHHITRIIQFSQYIYQIQLVANSIQCSTQIKVIDHIVLSPVHYIWAEARRVKVRHRPNGLMFSSTRYQKVSIILIWETWLYPDLKITWSLLHRSISYEVGTGILTQTTDIQLRVSFRGLKGVHRYGFWKSPNVHFKLKQFHVGNSSANALWLDLIVLHSWWNIAKDTLELLIRIHAHLFGISSKFHQKLYQVTAGISSKWKYFHRLLRFRLNTIHHLEGDHFLEISISPRK